MYVAILNLNDDPEVLGVFHNKPNRKDLALAFDLCDREEEGIFFDGLTIEKVDVLDCKRRK